jgi:hypothetical protein
MKRRDNFASIAKCEVLLAVCITERKTNKNYDTGLEFPPVSFRMSGPCIAEGIYTTHSETSTSVMMSVSIIILCFSASWVAPTFSCPQGSETCSFVREVNLVSDIKGGTWTEGVWEEGAEGDTWAERRLNNGRLEKKFYNEELHNLYSSPDIIRMIKSRRMRWAGHGACMEKEFIHSFGRKTWRKDVARKIYT